MPHIDDKIYISTVRNGFYIRHTWSGVSLVGIPIPCETEYVAANESDMVARIEKIAKEIKQKQIRVEAVDPVGTWIRRYGIEPELHEPKEDPDAPAPGPEESPKTP